MPCRAASAMCTWHTHYVYHYYQDYSRLVLHDTYHHSFVRSWEPEREMPVVLRGDKEDCWTLPTEHTEPRTRTDMVKHNKHGRTPTVELLIRLVPIQITLVSEIPPILPKMQYQLSASTQVYAPIRYHNITSLFTSRQRTSQTRAMLCCVD